MSTGRYFIIRVILLFVTVVIVTLMRNYNAFVLPTLPWEDGTKMFAFYTNDPSPLGIFRFYKGYTSLLPNIVGYLSTFAPPPITPYIMGIYSMILTGLAYTLFYLRRFRCVEENNQVRLFACMLLILMPLGNFAIMSSAMQSLWHLLWILILLVYAPLGSSALGTIAQFVLLGFAVWSHPSSVFVIPLYIYNFCTRPGIKDRLFNGGLFLLTIGYCRYGVQMSTVPEVNNWVQILSWSLAYFLDRVIFESLFGNRLRMTINQQGLHQIIYLDAVIVLVCCGLMTFLRYTALSRKDLWRLLGVSSLMIMLTISGVMRVGTEVANDPWNQRYVYIQQLLFLVSLVILANKVIRWRNWPKSRQAGCFVLIITYLLLLNWVHWDLFKSNAQEGRRLREFLYTLNEKKDQPVPSMPIKLTLDRGSKWSIRIPIKPSQVNR